MIDYQPLIKRWRGGGLDAWSSLLPGQIEQGLSLARYGDLPRWLQVLRDLQFAVAVGTFELVVQVDIQFVQVGIFEGHFL